MVPAIPAAPDRAALVVPQAPEASLTPCSAALADPARSSICFLRWSL